MADLIALCNQALSLVGEDKSIASMDEASTEARQCKLWFDKVRDFLLVKADWNFARRGENLALYKMAPGTPEYTGTPPTSWNNTLPPVPWLYSYLYPSDAAKVQSVTYSGVGGGGGVPIFGAATRYATTAEGERAIPFSVGSDVAPNGDPVRTIQTNLSQAYCKYTRIITNSDSWDISFQDVFQIHLAASVVMGLTGSRARAEMLRGMARQALAEAAVEDANEGLTIQTWTPEWIQARGYTE